MYLQHMRYLVKARVKTGKERALARAIALGTVRYSLAWASGETLHSSSKNFSRTGGSAKLVRID